MKPMFFHIDGGTMFPGFTEGEYWNGWACPFFTFEVAQSIIAEFSNTFYDEKSDSFITREADYPVEEWERYVGVIKNGVKLYPVGNCSWIWDEEEVQ